MDSGCRPELLDFHGVWMTRYFTDSWEDVQNFQARPDDILIATYPKAGQRTWTVSDLYLTRKRSAVMWLITLFSSCSFALSFRNNVGVSHSRSAVFWSDAPRASNLHVHLWTGSFFGNPCSVHESRFDKHMHHNHPANYLKCWPMLIMLALHNFLQVYNCILRGTWPKKKKKQKHNEILFFWLFNVFAGVYDATHLSTTPRIIKTHFMVQFVPKAFWRQNCRVSSFITILWFFFHDYNIDWPTVSCVNIYRNILCVWT